MASLATSSAPPLHQYVEQFGVDALRTIAGNLALHPAGTRREHLIEAIAGSLGRSAHLENLKARLGPEHWFVLGLLPLRKGPMSVRALVGTLLARGLDSKQAFEVLEVLLAHGSLLPARLTSGSSRIPVDPSKLSYQDRSVAFMLAPGIEGWAGEYRSASLANARVDSPPTSRGAALHDLQRALALVVGEIGRKPLKLTVAGLPHKPEVARLAKTFTATAGSTHGRDSELRTATALVWFAVTAAVDAGWLQISYSVDGSSSLVAAARASSLLSEPFEEVVDRLFMAWLHGRSNDFAHVPTLQVTYGHLQEPWLRSSQYGWAPGVSKEQMTEAREALRSTITELVAPAADSWFGMQALAEFTCEHFPEMLFDEIDDYQFSTLFYHTGTRPRERRAYPDGLALRPLGSHSEGRPLYRGADRMEVEGAFIRHLVTGPLRWLGIVEVDDPGSSGRSERFRLTDLGKHVLLGTPLTPTVESVRGRVIVQPNFEVVVTDAASNWRLLSQLDVFAERRVLDRAATYQLTQEALVRGFDRGWTGARVLETLESATGVSLPQNVGYTLREWATLYEALTVREAATLLEADSPEQINRWLADDLLASLLGGRLGPTSILAPSAHLDDIQAYFAKNRAPVRTVDYAGPPGSVLRISDPDLIEVNARDLEPYLRYCLEALAEVVAVEGSRHRYRVTAGSVRRATEAGWSGPQIVSLLGAAATGPLPLDFRVRLLGWSGAIPRLYVEPLVAVELAAGPLSWAELQQIEAIGRLLRALPLPTLALARPEELETLQRELSARGLAWEAHAVTAQARQPDRMTVLREALQAFDSPRSVLREMVAQGLLSSAQARYYR